MIHIIANAAACSGSNTSDSSHPLNLLIDTLRSTGHTCQLHPTDHSGHGTELAASLPLVQDDILVIVGGDGSLNDVINGLSLPAPCPVCLIPSGTGNDLARGLHLDSDVSHAASIISGNTTDTPKLDLGECTFRVSDGSISSRRFAVSCGLGMDAAVCVSLQGSPVKSLLNRLHMGKLAYTFHGICEVLLTSHKKRTRCHLILDGTRKITLRDTAFLCCHNTPYEGGGFPFAPEADPRDARLNICAVTVPNRLYLFPVLLASLLGGRHGIFSRRVHLYSCRTAQIHADHPLPFHTDGETYAGVTDLKIRVLPSCLPLAYAPASAPHNGR